VVHASRRSTTATPPRERWSSVATERTIQQAVYDLVEQKRVDLVTASKELVRNPHQVFDQRRDLFEGEADGPVGDPAQPGELGVRSKALDVLLPERARAAGKVDGAHAPAAHTGDELLGREARRS
jgi:hypothetical protein